MKKTIAKHSLPFKLTVQKFTQSYGFADVPIILYNAVTTLETDGRRGEVNIDEGISQLTDELQTTGKLSANNKILLTILRKAAKTNCSDVQFTFRRYGK